MIVHNLMIPSEPSQPHYRFLMSDLHLGSPCADHAEIIADLERARRVGARVLINGDVFDAIGPKDRRYDVSTLHPDVARKKDLVSAIVDLGFGLLRPFADIIDVIGIGNHEEAWINYNHGDPVRLLIDKLNQAVDGEHKIAHGSFWGWINTKFKIPGVRSRPRHKLLYFHGTGGDSPVTKGTIDFARKGRNWSYDCLTFGHKHNLAVVGESVMDCTEAGKTFERLQLNLQTASYYRNYRQLGDEDILDYSYAARSAHPPKPIGGIFLILRPIMDADGRWSVRQDYASDVIAPWTPKQVQSSQAKRAA